MKILNNKFKKTLFIVFSSLLILIVGIVLLVSPIAKYLVEKYDVKYTGRQIKTGLIYVNPFTGYVHITNLKIYEYKNEQDLKDRDTIFFSAKGVSANFALFKIFSKTIEISGLTLNKPVGVIIQNKKAFNFSDLILKFSSKKDSTAPSSVHVNLLGIKVQNGIFHYREKGIPINYFIKNANFESSGKRWNVDTLAVKFSFLSGTHTGSAKGNITINFKNLDYQLGIAIREFDLNIIEQYLKDMVNYGHFRANVDADLESTGNFKDVQRVTNSGRIILNNFHLGKSPTDDYASFSKLVIAIEKLSPMRHIYSYDSISITQPYLKFERYEYLDNFQRMFGKDGANISAVKSNPVRFNLILKIADYIKAIGKNFFKSDFKIGKLAIYNGVLKFSDYSLSEKFAIEANPFNFLADSVDKSRKRVEGLLRTRIQPYGNIAVTLSINPNDSSDFDLKYSLQKLPVSLFNPYLITYTSFPADRGTIELNGTWNVKNGIIKSKNHLVVIDPRITRRLKNKDNKWIPTPLLMYFVRERGNVIDYEIPITGNLKDPKFHIRDVLFDILGNVFVKPPTTPYRSQVKYMENEIEKSLTLKWEMRQNSLLRKQSKFIDKMVGFLNHFPEASIGIYPMQYAEKEKEYILFFEAKKKYFLRSKDKNARFLTADDSLKVEKMSVQDSAFVHYVTKQVNDTMLFTMQEKCINYIGQKVINSKFDQLCKQREAAFLSNFTKKTLENRVIIFPGENTIPYNGFSFYKIVYKGEFPKDIIKANEQMNELNHSAPRKKFAKVRAKILGIL